MAVNPNPELQAERGDREQTLLYKLVNQFNAVDWETIVQRLIKIDANTDELEFKIDEVIVEAEQINLNTDELEARIGALNVTKETDPDAPSASNNGLLRGILEAANSIATSVAPPATPAVGAWTDTTNNVFTPFPSNACKSFRFQNNTGKEIAIALGGAGAEELIPNGSSVTYPVVADMNEWSWKNNTDTASVTITGIFDNT